jgi:hypothetical protein
VVLENGRVRLTGTGAEVLEHPEIGALYLGGSATVAEQAVPVVTPESVLPGTVLPTSVPPGPPA